MSALSRTERKYWARFMVWILVLYGAVCLIAWLAADSMIFVPQYGTRADPPAAVFIPQDDGSRLAVVHLLNPDAKRTIWYFHGNAEHLPDILPRLSELRDFGFSVFALEYPGYGTSGGAPSETRINASLDSGLAYLRTKLNVHPEALIVYGRSVGGGPAVEVARRERVAGLILESAFTSAYRVMTRWPVLLGDKFNNLGKLRQVDCPVLVIHGREDRVIPIRHGEALFAAARDPRSTHLWVDAAGHNDLHQWSGDAYRKALLTFAEKL
jgi:fermentation-respiration switch protein FrsA (DUF1100 family)